MGLAALECFYFFSVANHPVFLKLAGFEDMNKTLVELEFLQDQTVTIYGVSCP